MLPKDYINYMLTGVHCCDYSDASGMLLLDVDKIVLGQHDLPNTREQLRLVLFHPEQLGRCKACKRDVSRARAEHRAPHRIVQPGCFFGGTAVVPQNGRAQHRVRFIQRNKAVHLAAHAHACLLYTSRCV